MTSLKSKRLIATILGMLGVFLTQYLEMPEETTTGLIAGIAFLVGIYVAGQTATDIATKGATSAQGKEILSLVQQGQKSEAISSLAVEIAQLVADIKQQEKKKSPEETDESPQYPEDDSESLTQTL